MASEQTLVVPEGRSIRPRPFTSILTKPFDDSGVDQAAQTPARPAPLPAPVRPVVDTYHGVQVIDPYRWLERWDDSEVKAWTEAQNTYTHAQLDALPFMAAVHRAPTGGERIKSSDPPADFRKRPRLWHFAQRGTRADRGSVHISLLAARDEGEHPLINGPS
jgi:protease II